MLRQMSRINKWKLINYRQVADLVSVEFLHDLYNQSLLELNPVRFRNTVCIIESWMMKSYAPVEEWEQLGKRLGTRLINESDLRGEFKLYLKRSQGKLVRKIAYIQSKYKEADTDTNALQAITDLSALHYLALHQIYAINLVQFEHACTWALEQLTDSVSDIHELVRSVELTVSGREERRAIELSLDVTRGDMTLARAYEQYWNEFGYVRLGYGALDHETARVYANNRLTNFIEMSETQRRDRLESLNQAQTKLNPERGVSGDRRLDELSQIASLLGERRDCNKQLMGNVSAARSLIVKYFAKVCDVTSENLRYYLLSEMFDLS